ncbi:DoxX family protein [Candidatus Woesearchaeota archaeon]|nr:DoxX family protein [Candidatus Woesearchaeota archaeon]
MGYLETKYKDYLYVAFRIGAGALFFMFGLMKLFGLWGMPGGPAAFNTLIWYAGAAEFLIGLSLISGVLTRLASFFGVIEMIVAYMIGHALPNGWNPMTNQGGPAILFMLVFLVTFAYGAGKASLEKAVFGKEFF